MVSGTGRETKCECLGGNCFRIFYCSLTVGFMVSRPHHVGRLGSDNHHLVVVLVQERLVHLVSLGNRDPREENLNLLLEPVVSVGDVTR